MATGLRKPGEFCWINVMTPEPDKAMTFFGGLLGWTFGEIPGLGHSIKVGGSDIGGLFDVVSPQTPDGMPPVIGVMLKVESVDATAARVAGLGGRAMPAFDIGDQGRMAVCFAPDGAQFDVWESWKGAGTTVDSSRHGAPTWFETLTTDVDGASAFYTALFGWTAEPMPTEGFTYTTFRLEAELVAGMMAITPAMGNFPPHWGTYFAVADVDETVRTAGALGAAVVIPPQAISGVGRFAGLVSPHGVMFYVITYAAMD